MAKFRSSQRTPPDAARKQAPLRPSPDPQSEVLQRTERDLKQALDYAQAIIETVPPLLVLGNGQWNIPKLRTFLEEILTRHSDFKDFVVAHDFESIGRRTVLLSGHQVDNLQRILLLVDDITERTDSRAVMRASEIR